MLQPKPSSSVQSPEVTKAARFYCWRPALSGSGCKLPVPLPKGAVQTEASPPCTPLTTGALSEPRAQRTWKRLGKEPPDGQGQHYVGVFPSKSNTESQCALGHQDQVGVCEREEKYVKKRTRESNFRTEKREVNASGISHKPRTGALEKAVA